MLSSEAFNGPLRRRSPCGVTSGPLRRMASRTPVRESRGSGREIHARKSEVESRDRCEPAFLIFPQFPLLYASYSSPAARVAAVSGVGALWMTLRKYSRQQSLSLAPLSSLHASYRGSDRTSESVSQRCCSTAPEFSPSLSNP
jgi:hypothetical protein